jgi:hypothetical protein
MIFPSASRVKAARLFYLMTVPSYASGQLYRWEILEKAANFRRKKCRNAWQFELMVLYSILMRF